MPAYLAARAQSYADDAVTIQNHAVDASDLKHAAVYRIVARALFAVARDPNADAQSLTQRLATKNMIARRGSLAAWGRGIVARELRGIESGNLVTDRAVA